MNILDWIRRRRGDRSFQDEEKLPDWNKLRKSAPPIAGHVMDGDWILWAFEGQPITWHQVTELIAPDIVGDNRDDAFIGLRVCNSITQELHDLTVETLQPMDIKSPKEMLASR